MWTVKIMAMRLTKTNNGSCAARLKRGEVYYYIRSTMTNDCFDVMETEWCDSKFDDYRLARENVFASPTSAAIECRKINERLIKLRNYGNY